MIFIILLGLALVLAVLFIGLWNMGRLDDGKRSQKFMRWRVVTQALVILSLIMVSFFAS